MSVKRILLVFFLSFKFVISMDVYIPRNQKEKSYLEKIRDKQLILGVKTNHFSDDKIEGESLNDIIVELFNSYLQLNVKVKEERWDILHSDFQKGKIDIINFLTKTNEREKFTVFSNKILTEELVIISKDKNLNAPEDLNGVEIYISENSIHEKIIERFKVKNELQLKIIKTDNMDAENIKYFAKTNLSAIGESNKLNISGLPEASIGVKKEYENLNAIINNALEERYNMRIQNWLKKRRELIFKNKFFNSLTKEEYEYLKNLEPLKITYGNIENVSNYSFKDKKFAGVLPNLLSCLFRKLDINISQDKNLKKVEWADIYESFDRGEIDILTLSRTPEREKKFIFTRKIYNLNVYQIESLKSSSNTRRIGVIKNSIEESVSKEHFLEKNIKIYTNRENMISDLKNGRLTTILSLNPDIYDRKKYNIKILEDVPINLALNKDKTMLRDILNKAILDMVDLKDILKTSDLDRKKEILHEQERHKRMINIIILSCVILLLLTAYQSFKVIMHKKKIKNY